MSLAPQHLQLLKALLGQPTAPFREGRVRRFAEEVLQASSVPHFQDPFGNLVVGAGSRADYLRLLQGSREPVRVFIAHMDHPGFHGVRWQRAGVLRVRWLGGSPTRHLEGSRVWLADQAGFDGEGVLRGVRLRRDGLAIDTAEVHVDPPPKPRPAAGSLYGGLTFGSPVWLKGGRLYTRAADDLIGVFAILVLAEACFAQRRRPPFLGLLTRGEEVGLTGAVAHFRLNWLKGASRPVVCVSLEASRTLPGAEVGKGPIVRLGDRRTPFSPGPTQVLSEVAQALLPGRHQRRLMDGGSCEGSAAVAFGFATAALAVPLGNYHNQGLEGGPGCRGRLGPAPEFVHLDDVAGLLTLCRGLLEPRLPWADPWRKTRERLLVNAKHYDAWLRRG
ncbi:MAG: hypothetical protein K6T56_08395 [Burkholderiales bacterium]|nr:hypothetical protein [Burkholderiales bacterium]